MFRLLSCKIKEDKSAILLDDEIEDDHCPMSESLQDQLRDFCEMLVDKLCCAKKSEKNELIKVFNNQAELKNCDEEQTSWVDNLANFVISVPPALKIDDLSDQKQGTESFR